MSPQELAQQQEYERALIDAYDFKTANLFLLQTLEQTSQTYGEDSLECLSCLHNLGDWHTSKGEYVAAETVLRHVLKKYYQYNPYLNSDTASVLSSLGSLYIQTGNYREAIKYHHKAQQQYEYLAKKQASPAVAHSTYEISRCYEGMQKWDYAVNYAEKAALLFEKLFGFKHIQTAMAYMHMASLYRKTNRGSIEQGLRTHEYALETQMELSGENHPRTAWAHEQLALTHFELYNKNKGIYHYEQAVQRLLGSLGGKHPLYAMMLWRCCECYDKGIYTREQTLEMLYHILMIFRQTFEPKHQFIINVLKKIQELDYSLASSLKSEF